MAVAACCSCSCMQLQPTTCLRVACLPFLSPPLTAAASAAVGLGGLLILSIDLFTEQVCVCVCGGEGGGGQLWATCVMTLCVCGGVWGGSSCGRPVCVCGGGGEQLWATCVGVWWGVGGDGF